MGHQDYKKEAMDFQDTFSMFQNKKIVLYGIGRFTATLLPLLDNRFNIIGLLDKDPKNIGREMYGLPILSPDEASKRADMVIINTSPVYWETIFKRIQSFSIPIYYLDGNQAKYSKTYEDDTNPYWNTSLDELKGYIEKAEIISFDIFDTLFMRRIFLPIDVFSLVENELEEDDIFLLNNSFCEHRKISSSNTRNLNLDEIYNQIQKSIGINTTTIEKMKSLEMEMEERLICPRYDVVHACNYANKIGKTVFFLTDMYLLKKL